MATKTSPNGKTNAATVAPFAPDLAAQVIDQTDTVITYSIKLPVPISTKFRLHLRGRTSLVLDAFSGPRKEKFAKTQDGSPKVKPGPRKPEEEFEEARYHTADGRDGVPKLAFVKAFQAAAIRMTEIKGTEVLAAFSIDTPDEVIPLDADTSEPEMRVDHVVRVGRGNLAYRPEYKTWGLWLPIELDHEVVTLDQFIHIVRKAGVGIGIGNWRPEKKGDHGTWDLDDVSEITQTRGVTLPLK